MRWWETLEGPLLGRYRVESVLGRGGMAEVLLARDERFGGKRVAIKAPMLDSFAPNQLAELLLRFQREVERQGSESITGVVPIFDAGEVTDSRGNSQPFLVMDFLSGGSLGDRLGGSSGRREHTQTLGEVLEWLRPVATTLDRLHARKYLHRDVKPDNILFNADGDPFLADFGIATSLDDVAGAGTMMSVMGSAGPGSPGYQSPESLRGDKLATSDQFSLAVTAYEALAGRLPMNATTRDGWIGALANWNPTPIAELCPELPAAATAALMRALSVQPRERYLSCTQFAQALAEATSVVPAAAPRVAPATAAARTTAEPGPSRPVRARPRWRWSAALALLAVLGIGGVLWWVVYPELRNDALREGDSARDDAAQPAADALVVEARSLGLEGDTREITEAALKTQRLERTFNAAAQAARVDADSAQAAPGNAEARARALESSLDAARKAIIAARSAQSLAALSSNWLDHYRERGAGLLDYALDVAQRAAEIGRNPPSAALGLAPDTRFATLAAEAQAVQERIAAEIVRRQQLGNVPEASGPAGASELVARVAKSGKFAVNYAESRARVAGAAADAETCNTEETLSLGEGGNLQHDYFSGCPESYRIFNTQQVFKFARAPSKDRLTFDANTTLLSCAVNDGSTCPGFEVDQPQSTSGSLELVTEDLVVLSIRDGATGERVRHVLLARVVDERPAAPSAPAPVAAPATATTEPTATDKPEKTAAVPVPEPFKPSGKYKPGTAGAIAEELGLLRDTKPAPAGKQPGP